MIRGLLFILSAALASGAVEVSKPIILSPEEGIREGKALAQEIVSLRPAQNTISSGVLKRRPPTGPEIGTPVRFEIQITSTNWLSIYEAPGITNGVTKLTVIHNEGQPNEYRVAQDGQEKTLSGSQVMTPFAGSDFWVADLGLDFLYWPEQRVLKKEIRRGQSCSVLESINPGPARGGYARVVSWVDIDTDGIINADAYGADGKRMKEFAAKRFKKVRGQWELKEIEMSDLKADSRTLLEFDLNTN